VERVLIIEKDEKIAASLAKALEKAGYTAVKAGDVRAGLRKLRESLADLIVIAEEVTPKRREEVLGQLRQATYVPLIVIGAGEEAAEVLELGADAYVTRPPDSREVVARVKALLRRKAEADSPPARARLHIEKEGSKKHDALTPTELRIVASLEANMDKLLDYPRLMAEVWGDQPVKRDTLHYYIRRLRNKLDNRILGLRGIGYRLSRDSRQALSP